MKNFFIVFLFSYFLFNGIILNAVASGPPPGVLQSGAVTTGHCTSWVGNNSIQDAGSACGSGASVSVTSASNDIVITPSPGTGSFTVGSAQQINAQGTAATYTILSTDMGKTITHNKATAVADSLPTAGGAGFEAGKSFCVINLGVGTVTITPVSGTINLSATLPLTTGQGGCLTSDGSNYTAFLGAATGAGSGTVTSVSVTTANGVSGSVATSTTTPAITLTLGAITPTSVAASKTVTCAVVPITVNTGAFATDVSTGCTFVGTPTHSASTAMSAPTNPVDGQKIIYTIAQDSTGSGTIAWNVIFDFGTSGTPTLTTTANKHDLIGFQYNATAVKWNYLGSQLGFAN